jgi:hypothetical protein
VPDYFASSFLVAGHRPIPLHVPALRRRLAEVDLAASFDAERSRRLVEFVERGGLRRLWQRRKVLGLPEERFNRDLHPRDEYFLNNGW